MMINWNRIMPARSRDMSKEDLDRFAKSVPDPDRRRSWMNARTAGTPVEQIEESYRRVVTGYARIERELREHAWIAGDSFSLADIDVLNFVGFQSYWPPAWIKALTNETMTPATCDWLARLSERPAVKEMHKRTVRPQVQPGGAWMRQPAPSQAQAQRAN